jgi:hypothetical protein
MVIILLMLPVFSTKCTEDSAPVRLTAQSVYNPFNHLDPQFVFSEFQNNTYTTGCFKKCPCKVRVSYSGGGPGRWGDSSTQVPSWKLKTKEVAALILVGNRGDMTPFLLVWRILHQHFFLDSCRSEPQQSVFTPSIIQYNTPMSLHTK